MELVSVIPVGMVELPLSLYPVELAAVAVAHETLEQQMTASVHSAIQV